MAVITVSREYGSCGEEIAQQLAKELGYSYIDKEILADVAHAAGTTEDQVRQYDEKDAHGLRAFLRKFLVGYPISAVDFPYYPPGLPLDASLTGLPPDASLNHSEREPFLDADKVTALLREVVENLWKRGDVVIVGRASQKILAAQPNTLHARFIGFIGDRGKQVMESENITYVESLDKIQSIDEQRERYLKHYYNADWRNPKHYHLVINTSLMSIGQAVKVIVAAVHQLEREM